MVDSGSLHGKGGPAHAVEGAAHHGPTGTVYPGVGKRRVDEGGLVWGLWHQPPDGGQMAGALSGPRGGGVSRRPHTQPHQPAAAHVRGASRPPAAVSGLFWKPCPACPGPRAGPRGRRGRAARPGRCARWRIGALEGLRRQPVGGEPERPYMGRHVGDPERPRRGPNQCVEARRGRAAPILPAKWRKSCKIHLIHIVLLRLFTPNSYHSV